MNKFFLLFGIVFTFASTVVAEPKIAPELESTFERIEYTESQLSDFGFDKNDLKEYKRRLNTIEGQWWGHLSPMEMMMYSAKTEDERRRFAKMYLTSNNPKAQAERKSAIAMYSAAREILADQLSDSLSDLTSKPTILFVNVDCKDCASEVRSVVAGANQKVDIYVTSLNRKLDIEKQVVSWASALNLPPNKVTLNDDKGIFQRSYGQRLSRLKVIEE